MMRIFVDVNSTPMAFVEVETPYYPHVASREGEWGSSSSQKQREEFATHEEACRHYLDLIETLRGRGYSELAPWLRYVCGDDVLEIRPPTVPAVITREGGQVRTEPHESIGDAIASYNRTVSDLTARGHRFTMSGQEEYSAPEEGFEAASRELPASDGGDPTIERYFVRTTEPRDEFGPIHLVSQNETLQSLQFQVLTKAEGPAYFLDSGQNLTTLSIYRRGEHGVAYQFASTGEITHYMFFQPERVLRSLYQFEADKLVVWTDDGKDEQGEMRGSWMYDTEKGRREDHYDPPGQLCWEEHTFHHNYPGLLHPRTWFNEDGSRKRVQYSTVEEGVDGPVRIRREEYSLTPEGWMGRHYDADFGITVLRAGPADKDRLPHGTWTEYDDARNATGTIEYDHGNVASRRSRTPLDVVLEEFEQLEAAFRVAPHLREASVAELEQIVAREGSSDNWRELCACLESLALVDAQRTANETVPWIAEQLQWDSALRMAPAHWVGRMVVGKLPTALLNVVSAITLTPYFTYDPLRVAPAKLEARESAFQQWTATIPSDIRPLDGLHWSDRGSIQRHLKRLHTTFRHAALTALLKSPLCRQLRVLDLSTTDLEVEPTDVRDGDTPNLVYLREIASALRGKSLEVLLMNGRTMGEQLLMDRVSARSWTRLANLRVLDVGGALPMGDSNLKRIIKHLPRLTMIAQRPAQVALDNLPSSLDGVEDSFRDALDRRWGVDRYNIKNFQLSAPTMEALVAKDGLERVICAGMSPDAMNAVEQWRSQHERPEIHLASREIQPEAYVPFEWDSYFVL